MAGAIKIFQDGDDYYEEVEGDPHIREATIQHIDTAPELARCLKRQGLVSLKTRDSLNVNETFSHVSNPFQKENTDRLYAVFNHFGTIFSPARLMSHVNTDPDCRAILEKDEHFKGGDTSTHKYRLFRTIEFMANYV